MVKRIFVNIVTAGMALSVLLCGCEKESCGDVILIGSAGVDAGVESSAETGTSRQTNSAGTSGDLAASENPETPMIRVYVCGAVVCPGVVEIPQGSRIEDALRAAGGFLADALTEAVNLADWASDGQMLYFPTEEEAAAWSPMQEGIGVREEHAQAEPAHSEQGKLVNINTAGAALLCTLPGIGEAKAADIIAYREVHGGFASCEDIMKVPGIKTNTYEKIRDKITVKQ